MSDSGDHNSEILVVEDSRLQAERLRHLLAENGYGVTVAADGRQGLAATKRDRPDLVISDIMMPELNGYDMCRTIKDDEEIKDIPVLMLTSKGDAEDIVLGLMAKADYYLTKPYDEKYLLSRVESILSPSVRRRDLKQHIDKIDHEIIGDPQRILAFLLSTYENAVQVNRELIRANTELRQAEQKLRKQTNLLIQSEKMGSVGTMAAGIAHELLNPLMGILNYAQFCLKRTAGDDPRHSVLQDIEHETVRCTGFVKNMLGFSRMEQESEGEYQKERFDTIMEGVLKLLSYRLESERVTLTWHSAEDTPAIPMRANGMQQVLLNLINNAIDAVTEKKKKEIKVDVCREGESIRLCVSDNGIGIAPENLRSIFDPFFTTKPVGKGTGLGMPIVYSIIHAHGGEITCQSKPGEGTTFDVRLPIETERRVTE